MTIKLIFNIIQNNDGWLSLEENAWLNVRTAERKLLTLEKAGQWLVVQTEQE